VVNRWHRRVTDQHVKQLEARQEELLGTLSKEWKLG
jgi:hypothetical protein